MPTNNNTTSPTDNNQTNSELDKVLKEVANEVADIYVDYFGINSPEGILEYVTSLFGSVASNLHKSGVDGLEYASKVKQYLYTNAFDIKAGGVVFAIDLAAKTMRLKDTSLDYSGATKGLIPYPDKNYLGKVIQVTGTTGVSLALGLLVPGGVIAATIASGAINNALNAIWGSLVGPHIMTIDFKEQENAKVLERKYISEGNFKDTISHNWSDIFGVDIKSDINSLRRVIIQTTDSGGNIIYYRNEDTDVNKNGPLHTYEIPSGSKAHLLEFLKRFESNYVAHIKLGVDEVRKLLVNYYANYGANAGRVESDLKNKDDEAIRQAAAHCLDKLKGYALDDSEGKNPGNYKDLTIYSNSHISDRVAFLKEYVLKDIGEKSSSNIYYIDFNNGRVKDAGNDLKINGDEANDEVVFIDGGRTKESFAVSNRKVYGYSKDDTIIYKYGNNYIEAGKGSDTITTGSGNDTIYTNADIDDEFDTEDKNTTNTVNSGAGDDTIYGSKGKDKITTKKGTNHIYTKSGDDEVNVEDGKNYIYLGSGSDKVNTNNGTNYIYTGINNTNENDQDTKDDINTINLTYGKNEVYGSKGMDLITSKNATKNYIVTKEGDDVIDIYGGEFNQIYTGKGSDTITINSAKGPNYIYTSTDSRNSQDQDTKDDINTVVITTGQNYIYGGKGVENLHILKGINNANLDNGKNTVEIAGGNNTIVLGEDEDIVNISGGTNFIEASDGDDTITATAGTNTIHAGKGNDIVTTGSGNDIIYSDDYDGDKEDNDILKGGDGYDKYYVGNGDTIEDSDGNGNIWFKHSYPLSGGKETKPGSKIYKGDGYTYHLNGSELKVTHDESQESITINNFSQEEKYLGITLENKVGLRIKDVTKNESDKTAEITIELVGEITGDGSLDVFMRNSSDKAITFKKGDTIKTYKYDISDYDDFIVNTQKIRSATNLHPYWVIPHKSISYDPSSSKFGDLKIKDDDSPLKLFVSSAGTSEAAEKLYTNVTATGKWQKGMRFDVKIGGKIITLDYNNQSKRVKLTTWTDDKLPEEDCKFYVRARFWSGNATVYDSGKMLCIVRDDDKRKDPNDPKYYDPIVIDMDGDGIELLPMDGTINFDHDNNGFKEATGWVSGDDAILAFDKNKNGIIDNGSELFGDHSSSNGFEELKKYDLNSDGFINKDDEIWYELVLWQDKNANGISDEGELTKLSESKIKAIDLRYTNVSKEFLENHIKQTTKVIFSDEKTAEAVDVNFKVDLSDTIMPETKISKDILVLPNVDGKGNLYDLHSAMMMNINLKDELKKYINANSIERKKLIKSLIYKWTGVENNPTSGRGAMKDTRELNVYEILTGEVFIHRSQGKNPNSTVANYLHELYQNFEDYVYAELELQTTYKGIIDTKYMILDEDTGILKYDFKYFKEKMLELFNNKKYDEMVILKDLVRDASVYKPRLASELNHVLAELSLLDEDMSKMLGNKHIFGDNENNTINGTSYNDYMNGNEGDDTLYGDGGNDILVGGEGNDNLNGGAGDDTYIFAKGDGKDIIDDGSGNDTIEFKEGITKDDLIIKHSSSDRDDLEISIKGTNDSITINEFFINSGRDFNRSYMIENFKFSDGTVLSYEDIQKLSYEGDDENNTIYGVNSLDNIIHANGGNDTVYSGSKNDTVYAGTGDDTLYGENGDDTLYGEEGKDTLYGGNGDDKLYGNEGDDTLYGDGGNDILVGGEGNDNLNGGAGDDTYIFAKGDGKDIINDGSGNDTIEFKEGITKDDLIIKHSSSDRDDLEISIKGTNDSITINEFFINSGRDFNRSYMIENFKFSDGTVLSYEDIQKLSYEGDDENNTIYGVNSLDNIIHANGGNDTVYSGSKNDTVYAGTGDDTLYGENGDDTLYGEEGKDTLYGGNGDDKLYGNEGDDTLYGDGGNDILVGGEGNDNLNGGAGDDTYIFAKGDGKDIINDGSGNDTIEFKEGITKDDLIIKHSSSDRDDLEISIKGTNDSITINEFFINSGRDFNRSYMIENFKFSDGTVLSYKDIQKLSYEGDKMKLLAQNQNYDFQKAEYSSLDDNSFITNDQINKVIQDLNSYGDSDSVDINFSGDFKNHDIMQLYNA